MEEFEHSFEETGRGEKQGFVVWRGNNIYILREVHDLSNKEIVSFYWIRGGCKGVVGYKLSWCQIMEYLDNIKEHEIPFVGIDKLVKVWGMFL